MDEQKKNALNEVLEMIEKDQKNVLDSSVDLLTIHVKSTSTTYQEADRLLKRAYESAHWENNQALVSVIEKVQQDLEIERSNLSIK
ncbi:hypothetical protein ACI2JA_15530 [Alkalihalobacillus sp. NPDC078783]